MSGNRTERDRGESLMAMATTGLESEPGPDDLEISVAEYLRAWQGDDVRLVDVREPEEWAAGRMPRAAHVPLGELVARLSELDPAAPTVLVCRSGMRSLLAAEHLTELGFARPVSLAGGILAWAEAGQPVER